MATATNAGMKPYNTRCDKCGNTYDGRGAGDGPGAKCRIITEHAPHLRRCNGTLKTSQQLPGS